MKKFLVVVVVLAVFGSTLLGCGEGFQKRAPSNNDMCCCKVTCSSNGPTNTSYMRINCSTCRDGMTFGQDCHSQVVRDSACD